MKLLRHGRSRYLVRKSGGKTGQGRRLHISEALNNRSRTRVDDDESISACIKKLRHDDKRVHDSIRDRVEIIAETLLDIRYQIFEIELLGQPIGLTAQSVHEDSDVDAQQNGDRAQQDPAPGRANADDAEGIEIMLLQELRLDGRLRCLDRGDRAIDRRQRREDHAGMRDIGSDFGDVCGIGAKYGAKLVLDRTSQPLAGIGFKAHHHIAEIVRPPQRLLDCRISAGMQFAEQLVCYRKRVLQDRVVRFETLDQCLVPVDRLGERGQFPIEVGDVLDTAFRERRP
ncbi:hypothetical protein FHT93_006702 [Rhizobium sp. BK379]|nr:hypothetical protein [Rhizobium sp. BK379]